MPECVNVLVILSARSHNGKHETTKTETEDTEPEPIFCNNAVMGRSQRIADDQEESRERGGAADGNVDFKVVAA
jgi:hypothetical protein